MEIPLVDLQAQYETLKPEIDSAIQRVLAHTGFILGEEVEAFEAAFAAYVGSEGAVGVASGTAALCLALQACGVGPGDEVITSAHTFFATAEAISQLGARPLFVDIDPQSYTLDPEQVEAALSERTRAILPVHLYGHPAELTPLLELAEARGLYVIEDAAQAHGAEYRGQRCGSVAHLGCFSFYPGKNLGAYGDAGMVTGNDPALLARIRRLRNHGRTSKYEHVEVGWGERLDTLQAAILQVKLPYLEQWSEARRALAARYNALLADCEVVTPYEAPWARHVYHLYVIRTPQRDALLAHLHQAGIGAGIHYPLPLHQQPAYQADYEGLRLPVTEASAAQVLSLPLYPEMSEAQQDRVVEAIKEVVR